jgi:hypothetical protein
MKKITLAMAIGLATASAVAAPAFAQVRMNNRTQTNSNPTMVRIPPSSIPGSGLSQSTTSSTKSMYPNPIKQDYSPNDIDPTARNPDLRKH